MLFGSLRLIGQSKGEYNASNHQYRHEDKKGRGSDTLLFRREDSFVVGLVVAAVIFAVVKPFS